MVNFLNFHHYQIHSQLVEKKIATNYNTDNKGKLFVTLFASAPASKTDL
jgi:hypothetical protein